SIIRKLAGTDVLPHHLDHRGRRGEERMIEPAAAHRDFPCHQKQRGEPPSRDGPPALFKHALGYRTPMDIGVAYSHHPACALAFSSIFRSVTLAAENFSLIMP